MNVLAGRIAFAKENFCITDILGLSLKGRRWQVTKVFLNLENEQLNLIRGRGGASCHADGVVQDGVKWGKTEKRKLVTKLMQ